MTLVGPMARSGVPYPLEALRPLGAIQNGEIDVLVAPTGSGKSTAIRSIIFSWLAAGFGVVLCGTEMSKENTERSLVAAHLGFDPGDVLDGTWEGWPNYAQVKISVDEELARLRAHEGVWNGLVVTKHDAMSVTAIQQIGEIARKLEAGTLDVALASTGGAVRLAARRVVIVLDHVDHLSGADTSYKESVAVFSAMLAHGKKHGTRWLCTSQVNRAAATPGDPLWRYRPVQEHTLANGDHKARMATRVFGVYRPLRHDATAEELKAAREGRADALTVVSQGVAMINIMKHRHKGKFNGKRLPLGYENGRLTEPPDTLVRALQAAAAGVRTSQWR